MSKHVLAAVLLALAVQAQGAALHPGHALGAALHPRQAPAAGATNNTDDILSVQSYMATGYTNGSVAPGTWSTDSSGQYVVVNPSQDGADDNSQVSWCPTIYIGDADVGGAFKTGWTSLPQLVNFNLARDLVVDKASNAILPYYVERGKDFSKVKRVVCAISTNPYPSVRRSGYIVPLCAYPDTIFPLFFLTDCGPAWSAPGQLESTFRSAHSVRRLGGALEVFEYHR